jgi:hypothetical protein
MYHSKVCKLQGCRIYRDIIGFSNVHYVAKFSNFDNIDIEEPITILGRRGEICIESVMFQRYCCIPAALLTFEELHQ